MPRHVGGVIHCAESFFDYAALGLGSRDYETYRVGNAFILYDVSYPVMSK